MPPDGHPPRSSGSVTAHRSSARGHRVRIRMNTSSRCHLSPGRGRRRRRQPAKCRDGASGGGGRGYRAALEETTRDRVPLA